MAVGSSGTLETLIRLAAGRRGGPVPASVNQLAVTAAGAGCPHPGAAAHDLSRAGRPPGVDARRADLLPAGALLAMTSWT